jgi:hypothetical protein
MAYNIGEKPGKGSYVCPNCGCRVGEITTIARREVTGPTERAIQPTYTVKSLTPHFARLKSLAFVLVLAGLMFASGFAAKTLLSGGPSIESPGSGNPSSADTTVNANSGHAGVSPTASTTSVGNPGVTVWVNTQSGVYHCANTRWYGNTKSGTYMTQKEAQAKGYRPAHGSVCG